MNLASFYAVDKVGAMVAKEVEKNASEIEEFTLKNKLAGQVDVSSDERGNIITLSDTVLFPAGKPRMTSVGNDLIKQVFDLLQQFNYNVKIEGHTDNSPVRIEQFPSNWELSAARAAEVARELVEAGFPPPRNCLLKVLRNIAPKYPITFVRPELPTVELKLFINAVAFANIWWMSSAAIVDRSLRIYSPGIL